MDTIWRKCSSCKKPITFGARYFQCSVSTCNSPRTGYAFCTVPCWEVHLPSARHKDAAAIEAKAPAAPVSASEGIRRIVTAAIPTPGPARANVPKETLIIASRLKEYIQARADMSTAGSVMDLLSEFVRIAADHAIDQARADGRRVVQERDFIFLKKF